MPMFPAVPVLLALLSATPRPVKGPPPPKPGDLPRLCEVPADCGQGGVCVGFVCRMGSDQSRVEVMQRMAVLPPIVTPAALGLDNDARRLLARITGDLAFSGFYEVVPETSFPQGWQKEGASPAEVRRISWATLGIGRIVMTAVGQAPAERGGGFEVRIRAVDIERWNVIDLPAGRFALKRGLSDPEIAALSAQWVNALVGWDTGIAGSLGTRIVGSTEVKPGIKEVAIIGIDGTGWRQLTNNGSLNLHAAWGPAGTIGWMSYVTGNADWWALPASGEAKPFSTRPGLNANGAWSPDGRYLALSLAETGDSELVLLDAKTGDEEARLTDSPALDTSPAWSPDGKRLAFVSDRVGNNPQVFVLSLTGAPMEQVTFEGYNAGPEWSPNGHTLIYVRQSGNDFTIMRYDFDTKTTRRLTQGRGSAESPSFSPDGRYIAYSLTIDKSSQLWVMNADGENQRQLGGEALNRSFLAPAWERIIPAAR